MQFTSVAIALFAAASSAVAAPAAAQTKNMMATGTSWTMQSFLRQCNSDDTLCNYSFSVNENNGNAATPCAYEVSYQGSIPASRAAYQNVQCGSYTIGSTWSGQFGPGNGFQTLSVVEGNLIIFPAYTDNQLDGNTVVTPDQSYTPQTLP